MPCQKRTLDEPAIRELLTGLVHSGKRYYRPNPTTGFYIPVLIRAELMKLDMSGATVSRLIRLAMSAGLITEGNINRRAVAKQAQSLSPQETSATGHDTDDEDEEMEEFGSRHSKSPLGLQDIERSQLRRYQLVKSGDWYGVWDDEYGYQELVSKDKAETLERIYQLQRKGSHDPFQWPKTGSHFLRTLSYDRNSN
jgi:hypothetical protein